MANNLIERVLRDYLYNVYERDWEELANCVVDDPQDKSFIDKPTPRTEGRMAILCATCPVFSQCKAWADREGVTGVYIAGEWRE